MIMSLSSNTEINETHTLVLLHSEIKYGPLLGHKVPQNTVD